MISFAGVEGSLLRHRRRTSPQVLHLTPKRCIAKASSHPSSRIPHPSSISKPHTSRASYLFVVWPIGGPRDYQPSRSVFSPNIVKKPRTKSVNASSVTSTPARYLDIINMLSYQMSRSNECQVPLADASDLSAKYRFCSVGEQTL